MTNERRRAVRKAGREKRKEEGKVEIEDVADKLISRKKKKAKKRESRGLELTPCQTAETKRGEQTEPRKRKEQGFHKGTAN